MILRSNRGGISSTLVFSPPGCFEYDHPLQSKYSEAVQNTRSNESLEKADAAFIAVPCVVKQAQRRKTEISVKALLMALSKIRMSFMQPVPCRVNQKGILSLLQLKKTAEEAQHDFQFLHDPRVSCGL
jgi:hypothetical protein